LRQGGFDWGFLAYAVGFGGSMLWFGSSAGVALSNMYPEAKSAVQWLKHGWHVVAGLRRRLLRDASCPRLASLIPATRRPWHRWSPKCRHRRRWWRRLSKVGCTGHFSANATVGPKKCPKLKKPPPGGFFNWNLADFGES
jgi:hypothetical protein